MSEGIETTIYLKVTLKTKGTIVPLPGTFAALAEDALAHDWADIYEDVIVEPINNMGFVTHGTITGRMYSSTPYLPMQ
jgi:hypothetical protein